MPMYEVIWTETKVNKANVLIPNDDEALHAALGEQPRIIGLIEADNNPVVSAGKTVSTVTSLGRVMPDGEIKPL
jgi:hypothetical protein